MIAIIFIARYAPYLLGIKKINLMNSLLAPVCTWIASGEIELSQVTL